MTLLTTLLLINAGIGLALALYLRAQLRAMWRQIKERREE
jgi:hypothetical protein